jgi:hypothetical protein
MPLQRVVRSTIIDAPIERVWAVLRDFNSHVHWHPVVADSHIEEGLAPPRSGLRATFARRWCIPARAADAVEPRSAA